MSVGVSPPPSQNPTGPGWTVETLRIHMESLRAAQERFDTERDRRYMELQVEREKALKVKEEAHLRALELASTIQAYKDEKANELRAQINSERGLYASHSEVGAAIDKVNETLKPLIQYYQAQQGGPRNITTQTIVTVVAVFGGVVGIVIALMTAFNK